jgi:hypothetical protein
MIALVNLNAQNNTNEFTEKKFLTAQPDYITMKSGAGTVRKMVPTVELTTIYLFISHRNTLVLTQKKKTFSQFFLNFPYFKKAK